MHTRLCMNAHTSSLAGDGENFGVQKNVRPSKTLAWLSTGTSEICARNVCVMDVYMCVCAHVFEICARNVSVMDVYMYVYAHVCEICAHNVCVMDVYMYVCAHVCV
jgi:hypothetical protein